MYSTAAYLTPVCTTEFIAFAKMYPEFKKRNCELMGLSIDSNPSHLSWIHNIHRNTGIQIPFPVIADRDMKIAKMYGMIAPNVSDTQTVRSVFYIDPEQKIRAIMQYPKSNGRNISEILRLLDGLQMTDKENVSTPANWFPGQPTIVPSPSTYNEIMENMNGNSGYNCIDWYLCFKQSNATMPTPKIEKNNTYESMNDINFMNTMPDFSNAYINNVIPNPCKDREI